MKLILIKNRVSIIKPGLFVSLWNHVKKLYFNQFKVRSKERFALTKKNYYEKTNTNSIALFYHASEFCAISYST